MDLFLLSRILTILDWVCNGIISLGLIFKGAFFIYIEILAIFGILPLLSGVIIVILSLLNIGEFVGFVKKSRGLMIYSILPRILWLTLYAGTFLFIENYTKVTSIIIIIPIILTTYGLARLILQIYIVVNFEKLAKTNISSAQPQ